MTPLSTATERAEAYIRQNSTIESLEHLLIIQPSPFEEQKKFKERLSHLSHFLKNVVFSSRANYYDAETNFKKIVHSLFEQSTISRELQVKFVYQHICAAFIETEKKEILWFLSTLSSVVLPEDYATAQVSQSTWFLKSCIDAKKPGLLQIGYEHNLFSYNDYHLFITFLNSKPDYSQVVEHNCIFINSHDISTYIYFALGKNTLEYSQFLAQKHNFSLLDKFQDYDNRKKGQLYIDCVANNNGAALRYLTKQKFYEHKGCSIKSDFAKHGLSQLFQSCVGTYQYCVSPEFEQFKSTLQEVISIVLYDKQLIKAVQGKDNISQDLDKIKINNLECFFNPFFKQFQSAYFSSNPSVVPNTRIFLTTAVDLVLNYITTHKTYTEPDIAKAMDRFFSENSHLYDYDIRQTIQLQTQQHFLNRQTPEAKSLDSGDKKTFKL